MIIGFDIDGILTQDGCEVENYNNNNKKIWKYFLEDYLGKKLERQNNSYNFAKAYGFPTKEMIKFFEEEMSNIIPKFKVNQEIKYIINKLYEDGNTIYLITARDNKKEIKNATIKWLKDNNIKYHEIYFLKEKGQKAKELGIEWFFEDHIKNAEDLQKNNIKVFMLGKYHNQPKDHKNHPALIFKNNSKEMVNAFFNLYKHKKQKIAY